MDYAALLERNTKFREDRGVACGKTFISHRKKCSKAKAATTPKVALKRTAEIAKASHKLSGEVVRDKGKKARDIDSVTPGYQEKLKALAKPGKAKPEISRDKALDMIYGKENGMFASSSVPMLKTSEVKKIVKLHPDLRDAVPERQRLDPKRAEVGDVVIFNGTKRAHLEFAKLHPLTRYYRLTSAKNGRLRGEAIDQDGKLIAGEKPRPLPAKEYRWGKLNFPEDEFAGRGQASSAYQKAKLSDPFKPIERGLYDSSPPGAFDRQKFEDREGLQPITLNKGASFGVKKGSRAFRSSASTVKETVSKLKSAMESAKTSEATFIYEAYKDSEKDKKNYLKRLAKIAEGAGMDMAEPLPVYRGSFPMTDKYAVSMTKKRRQDSADLIARSTILRNDIATGCGRGWSGTKGSCVRTKVSASVKKAGHVAKHQGIHLAENVAAWKVGKVVGGMVAGVATAHGANPEAAKFLAESGVQALAATALSLRNPQNRKPADVATKFIAEAGAAMVGKAAHGGMESAAEALGQSAKVASISALISGKVGGIGTNVGLSRSKGAKDAGEWLAARGRRLQQFYGMASRRDDADQRIDDMGAGSMAELSEVMYELSAYAMLEAAKPGHKVDKVSIDSLLTRSQALRNDIAATMPAGGCGRGWAGLKGSCVRAKVGNSIKKVNSGTKKALKDDTVNVSTWAVGKAVGGALAGAAQAHGISEPPALLLAESATQALLTVGLEARKKSMGAGQIAKRYVTEVAALMATKYEPAWDDGVRGGSDEVRMMIDRATSKDAPAQAKAIYQNSVERLGALVKGRKLRLDADGFERADGDALLMLTMVGYGEMLKEKQGRVDSLLARAEALRNDRGVACGKTFISHRKKCSKSKAATTPKAALKRTAEIAKASHKLSGEVARDRGKKARDIGGGGAGKSIKKTFGKMAEIFEKKGEDAAADYADSIYDKLGKDDPQTKAADLAFQVEKDINYDRKWNKSGGSGRMVNYFQYPKDGPAGERVKSFLSEQGYKSKEVDELRTKYETAQNLKTLNRAATTSNSASRGEKNRAQALYQKANEKFESREKELRATAQRRHSQSAITPDWEGKLEKLSDPSPALTAYQRPKPKDALKTSQKTFMTMNGKELKEYATTLGITASGKTNRQLAEALERKTGKRSPRTDSDDLLARCDSLRNDARKCGRGWQGTYPGGCYRGKEKAASGKRSLDVLSKGRGAQTEAAKARAKKIEELTEKTKKSRAKAKNRESNQRARNLMRRGSTVPAAKPGRDRSEKLRSNEEGKVMGTNVRLRAAAKNDPRGKGVLPGPLRQVFPREIDHSVRKQREVLKKLEQRSGALATATTSRESSLTPKQSAVVRSGARTAVKALAGAEKAVAMIQKQLPSKDELKRRAKRDGELMRRASNLLGASVKDAAKAAKILASYKGRNGNKPKRGTVSIDSADLLARAEQLRVDRGADLIASADKALKEKRARKQRNSFKYGMG